MTRHKSQEERRHQILEAARLCFIRQGYEHSRMNDIAKAAELSKGGVYFHFSSKREIFDALVEEIFNESMLAMKAIRENPGTMAIKFQTLALFYLGIYATRPEWTGFLVVVSEMAIRDDELRGRLQGLHQVFIDEVQNLLRTGIAAGELRSVNITTTAALLKGMIDGLERHYALGDQHDLMALVNDAVDMVMNGLAPTDSTPS